MSVAGTVIVTGAAGFVGSHVSDVMEEQGFHVVRTDMRLPEPRRGTWMQADLTRVDDLVKLTQGAVVVCHIAGIGDVNVAAADPQLALHVNGCGTQNLLDASAKNGVQRFLFASTWEVYGPPRYEPIDEDHPCSPSHPCSISKLVGDLLVRGIGEHGPIQTVVLRLGTAYGARMRNAGVIPAFILKALRGEAIEVHGTGSQFRQFTHARDIGLAFALAAKAPRPGPVYNVVSPEKISIRQLAEKVNEAHPTRLVFRESRHADAPSAIIDSGRIGKDLGWKPQVTLEQGLREMVGYLQGAR